MMRRRRRKSTTRKASRHAKRGFSQRFGITFTDEICRSITEDILKGRAEFIEKRPGSPTALYRVTIQEHAVVVVFDTRFRRIRSVLYDLDKESVAYTQGLSDAEMLGYESNPYLEDTPDYWNYYHGFKSYRRKELL